MIREEEQLQLQHGVPSLELTNPCAAGEEMGVQAPGVADHQLRPTQEQQQKPGFFQEQQKPLQGTTTARTEGADFGELEAPEASDLGGLFPDEDAAVLADDTAREEAEQRAAGSSVVGGGGGGAGAGAGAGNRWPREETLALLRIRSEMDAVFRDASLKAPLWEDVSRKLAELGYKRSAKKCREKFENVHKYYKRAKEGRAGRQDGKSYKFFSQLEALNGRGGPAATVFGTAGSGAGRLQPTPLNAIPLPVGAVVPPHVGGAANSPGAVSHPSGGLSFSSNNSFSGFGSEGDTEDGHRVEQRKRKRGGRDGVGVDSGGPGSRRKMMIAFFGGLMRQVIEKQEAMQQKFLDMIEKREQERMAREEAWRLKEMARLTREHEAMAQEREMAASRDATIISFLQKMTGQAVPTPHNLTPAIAPVYPVAAQPLFQLRQTSPASAGHQPQPQKQQHNNHRYSTDVVRAWPTSTPQVAPVAQTTEVQEATGVVLGRDTVPSRWPKSEVHALIKLRSGMETKYQESGPKGPLWEEIAAGMRRLGYSRSAKRCKEKWENINKYFKKVKDSSKKRPEDAKTCPYFHQLDALYRRKIVLSGDAGVDASNPQGINDVDPKQESEGGAPCTAAPDSQPAVLRSRYFADQAEAKSINDDGDHMTNGSITTTSSSSSSIKPVDGNGGLSEQEQHRNGVMANDEGTSSDENSKEPEDAVKAPADRHQHPANMDAEYGKIIRDTESDSMDLQEEDAEKMEYRVEYHRRPAGANDDATNSSGAAAAGEDPPVAASFASMAQ